ncbi:unnamed protein product, partial [Pylaiella littoralis]
GVRTELLSLDDDREERRDECERVCESSVVLLSSCYPLRKNASKNVPATFGTGLNPNVEEHPFLSLRGGPFDVVTIYGHSMVAFISPRYLQDGCLTSGLRI